MVGQKANIHTEELNQVCSALLGPSAPRVKVSFEPGPGPCPAPDTNSEEEPVPRGQAVPSHTAPGVGLPGCGPPRPAPTSGNNGGGAGRAGREGEGAWELFPMSRNQNCRLQSPGRCGQGRATYPYDLTLPWGLM